MLSKSFIAIFAFIVAVTAQDGLNIYKSGRNSLSCLTAESLDNGAAVTVQTCNIQLYNQGFQLQNGALTTDNGAKCVEVVDGNTADGALVQISDCEAGNANQQWDYANNMLRWTSKGKALSLTDDSTAPGSRVSISTWVGGEINQDQVWNAVPYGNGF